MSYRNQQCKNKNIPKSQYPETVALIFSWLSSNIYLYEYEHIHSITYVHGVILYITLYKGQLFRAISFSLPISQVTNISQPFFKAMQSCTNTYTYTHVW